MSPIHLQDKLANTHLWKEKERACELQIKEEDKVLSTETNRTEQNRKL